jgi:hypothetical protein
MVNPKGSYILSVYSFPLLRSLQSPKISKTERIGIFFALEECIQQFE